MTKTTFHRLLIDAAECSSLDEYFAEVGGSLPAEYYNDEDAHSVIDVLSAIWELREDLTFRAVRKLSELTQAAFSQHYNIPIRSVQNWDTGERVPPDYLLELLAADVITEKFESHE